MRKGANRILSTLIVLIMVLSILPVAVFATGETASALEGWSITLGDDIGVKFRLSSADYTVTATVNGAAVTPTISGDVATVNVAAAQMTAPIVLTVKDGGETVHTGEYSVREYAETILNGEYDDYVKDMVKQMLNYGAAAQTYFNYKTNNLANAGYELDANADVPTVYPETIVTDNLEGIELYGTSLVLRNKTAVRFYFTLEEGFSIGDFTFSQGKLGMKHGMHFVEIDGINPQDLAKEIELKVDNGALSITYSPLSYIVRMYNNADNPENVKPLVQALYGYHEEAKYYDSVVPVGSLQSSVHGWSEGGIYATMPANDAYFVEGDWGIEYTPVNADVIKLVRGGETTSVGVPGNGTLIKFTATDYYLKTENHTISGDVLPLRDQDYLIVDGRFYHPATGSVMYISKTYIYNNNGTLEFSTTEPEVSTIYDVGVLQANVNGHGAYDKGIYFSTAETNDAPYGENGAWDTYYDSASVDCLKLVRNGQIISVGLTGGNTICKFSANDYALRLENNTIGDYAPFTTDDMFIVEGAYTHKNSKTTLNIAKTYIYYDGSNWVFSATEPVFEPETESPFTFDKGVFSADIFNNRNNGLSVSVENKQLKLQQPAGASNWLWLNKELKAGTVITMDVTFSAEGMNIFGYGSKANGDPITDGTVTESVPQSWFWGQGGDTSGSHTFTIYEDCYGLSLMLGFASSTETAIYIDNVVITPPAVEETESPFTFDSGLFSADIFNNRNGGLSVSVENKQLKLQQPAGASNWLWIKQDMKAGTVVTMDVTFSGDGMSIFGYGSKANGDPITEGTVTESVPQGWFWGQGGSNSGSYTFTIYEDCYGLSLMLGFAGSTETAIYIDNVVITAPEVVEPTVVSGGNMTEHGDGWDAAGDIFFALAENEIPVDENAETEYAAESGVIKLVRGDNVTELTGTVVKYGATDYYMVLSGDALPLQNKDYLIVEGNFVNAENNYILNVAKSYVLVDGEALVYSTTEPDLSVSYDVGVLQAHNAGAGGGGIYFTTQEVNDAPYGDWNTYYDTANEDCLKLVRNGQTISVGLTGRNTICKFGANDYYLKLEEHTIGSYAPFTTDDIFIVEGAYTHKNSKTTLNIAKTYIYYDGSNWVFSATEPVFEPETESPFTFDKGVFSADIFNHRNGGLSVSVENKQLKLQQPAGASNWLWLKQDMKAGTVITMDVTFSGEGMNIYGYGSNQNGDPITSGAVTEPAAWYNGQGGNASGSYTFTIYEDCYGLSLMLGFAGSTETAIYIDNVVITAPAPSTAYDVGVLQASVHGAGGGGIYFTTAETNDAPYGDWDTYYDTANEDCLKLVRGGETISVGLTGRNTICKFGANDYYLRLEEHTIGSYAPFTTDDMFIVEGAYTHKNSKTTLNIAKTYIYYDGSNWVFSATEPVFEPETESPFTFNKGVFSADIFNNRNNGLSVSVENKQLKLQQPAGASNWLWLRQNMKAGTVVTMDVTFSGEGMNIYGYGANGNGDPITEGTVTDSVPQSWFWGQGGSTNGSYTFTIYEDCYGLALMLGFAGSTETAIYIDNVVIKLPAETQSPFTFDGGSYSADIFNNRNGGLSVSVENKQLKLQQPAGASNWLWIKQDMPAGTVITMDVTFSAEGMNIFGYGAKANGDPITEGTATESVPQGWFWGQGGSTNGSYTFTIYEDCYGLSLMLGFAGSTETAIYIDNVVITKPIETDFGTVILPTSTDTLNIGVWNGSHHVFANEQLKQLQAAGITKITGVNTAHIGTDNVNAWLNRVYSYGIRVIFDLRGWDGETVPDYASHPGVLGFLMYDEPNANVFDDLAALKAKFDAVMPADKLFYVNLFPECAADSSLGETNWWDQLVGNNLDYDEDYVTEFLNKLDIEVLSWDNYSLLEGSGIRTEYFHNFEVMAGKNLPLWYTMLSAGHNATYATPTADELRWQMAVAMTYGVQNIDHYVYTSHEDGYSCMVDHNTLNVTDLYYDIKNVDNEYLAWDHIYMAYKWQGVGAYDAGTSNAMLTMLKNKLNLTNYGLTVTSSNEDLLVGVFDHNGNKAYMITNAGSAGSSKVGDGKSFTTADATVKVKLADGSYKCAAVIDNGEISFVAVNADNTVTLSVEAYEGVFIIPVLN